MKGIFKKIVGLLFTKKNKNMAIPNELVTMENELNSVKDELEKQIEDSSDERLFLLYKSLEKSITLSLSNVKDIKEMYEKIENENTHKHGNIKRQS